MWSLFQETQRKIAAGDLSMLPEVRIIKYATCICMNSVGKKLHLSRGGYYPGGGGGGTPKKKIG